MNATKEEWDAAWDAFNAATKKMGELCVRDNIRLKLTLPTFGPKPKKRGSVPIKEVSKT